MIRQLLLISCIFAVALAVAPACNNDLCKAPDCRCSSTDIPGRLAPADVPQMVLLTFDDAVTATLYTDYFTYFDGKVNPDGCPISATFFVAHEYSDCTKVHALHAAGHEIALHSITHNSSTEHWKALSPDGYSLEFDGEREILSHWAKIPIEAIQGIRVPFLQGSGDSEFSMLEQSELVYDCTWPTQSQTNPGLWPYTLDYLSTQDCPIGPCPTESHPGVWVVPMLNWRDEDGNTCAMTDACVIIPDTAPELTQYMIANFERSYNGNRAPFGFFLHGAWFVNEDHPERWEAYKAFVEYINALPDVYIVGISRALSWIKNPQPLSDLAVAWPECQATSDPACNALTCEVPMPDDETSKRWFANCHNECPRVYPWLGNPLGE